MKNKKINKEFLLSEINRFIKKNGKIPGFRDMRNYNGYPSISEYVKAFGSWKNALITAGYLKNHKDTEEYLLSEFERFIKENGRIPRYGDMKVSDGYPSKHLYERVFGSWKKALIAAGYATDHNYTDEYLISILREFKKKNGRYPYQRDMKASKGNPPLNCFYNNFGSWKNALKAADLTRMDDYYFSPENMTLRKWYILGYVIADGWVNKNYLRISTAEKDKNNLHEMNKFIEEENNMNPRKEYILDNKNGHKFGDKVYQVQPIHQIQFYNKRWIENLKLYGIVENKTHITYIPFDYLKTPEEEAAIMRGIFDGDGTVGVDINHWIDNTTITYNPIFKITGSRELCENYAFLIYKNCGIKCNVNEEKKSFKISTSGIENCKKIYDFLYGHENFFILRKRERLKKLLNGTFTPEKDNY